MNNEPDENEPVKFPIDGTLDLHTFHPRDVKDLVPNYLSECRARGILTVRIIHGKGTGTLRQIVHTALDRLPYVITYYTAPDASHWGATIVELKPSE